MTLRFTAALAAVLLVAGCASDKPTPVADAAGDPANPQAPESAAPPRSNTLDSSGATHEDHAASGMPGMMHGGMMMAHDPAAASRPATTQAMKYVCPMHAQVVSATPGTCPICHMKLEVAGGKGAAK